MDIGGRAYLSGLKMLARRELCEAQLRVRLSRRQFDPDDIDDAVSRLRRERALDDRRVALAYARTEAHLRQRGRSRVARQLEAMGIARDVARAAVAEVFAELDEEALLQQALEKRLRRGAPRSDASALRRIHRFLVSQGFEPGQVTAAMRSRIKAAVER